MKKQSLTPVPVICRQRYEEQGFPLQQVFNNIFSKDFPEYEFGKTTVEDAPEGMIEGVPKYHKYGPTDPFDSPKEDGKISIEYEDWYNNRYRLMRCGFYKQARELFAIKKKFLEVKNEAIEQERLKNYKEAVRLYEWLVAQEYPMPYAYDRLINIYNRYTLINETIYTLREAIDFFKSLKAKQLKYLGEMAQKYNVMDHFLDCISSKQKIYYYGAFELYNPFPIIEKWEMKLEKLCRQKTA